MDTSTQYRLYLTKNGLEVPDTQIVVPDILVQPHYDTTTHRFVYWNNKYWYAANNELSNNVDYVWCRCILVKSRENVAKDSRSLIKGWDELDASDPLG